MGKRPVAESSVRKRILRGTSANAYGIAVVVIVQLAGVPILLDAWGTQLYGGWLVLSSIPAYLSLTNLGFTNSIANDMTMRVARGDHAGALAAIHSLIALVAATGMVGGLVAIGFVFALPLTHWLHLVDLPRWQVRGILLLLAAEVLMQLIGGVAAAGYRANGDFALGVILNNSIMLCQYLALWAAALAGLGLVGAAAAFLLVRIVGNMSMLIHLMIRHRWLRLGIRYASLRYLRKMVSPSFANLLLPTANALKNQGLVLVISALLGPLAVVTFSILRTLTRLSLRLVGAISYAIEPEVAMTEGSEAIQQRRRLYQFTLRATFWMSVGAGVALFFAGNRVLELWTHGNVIMNYRLFFWLLAGSTVTVFWHVPLSVLSALNQHVRVVVVYVVCSALAVALSALLLAISGRLEDVGLALFFCEVAVSFFALLFISQAIKLDLSSILIGLVKIRPDHDRHAS